MQKENSDASRDQPERSHFVNIFSIIAEAMPPMIQYLLKQISNFSNKTN